MRQPGNEAAEKHQVIAVDKDSERIAERDDADNDEQQRLERHLARRSCHDENACADAGRISRNKVSGFWHRNTEIIGNGQKNRHHGEFGYAEGKRTESKGGNVARNHLRRPKKQKGRDNSSHPVGFICGRRLSLSISS